MMCMNCEECAQSLTVTPEQYEKYFSIYDALDETARTLFESGTREELDRILAAICFYLSPCTARIVLNLKGEMKHEK